MLNFVAKFTDWILGHRWVVLLFFAMLWAFDLYYVFDIEVNNEVESLVKPTDPRLQQYNKFLEWFGSDEIAIVSLEREKGIYDGNFLRRVSQLEFEFSKVPNTLPASSALAKYRQTGRYLSIQDEDIPEIKEQWSADPLNFKTGLLNQKGTAFSIVIPIEQGKQNARRLAVPGIMEVVEKAKSDPAFEGVTFHYVGQPFVNYTMDQSASEVGKRFFPVFFSFSILLSVIIYSSIMATISALITVGTAALTTIAFMAFLHVPMTLLSTALPVTLFIILLAGEIHFRNVFFNPYPKPETVKERLIRTMTLKWTATLISVATVQVGFGSLGFSDIPSIRDLGLFIAFGMMVGLLCHFTLFPVLISLFFRHTPPVRVVKGSSMNLTERTVHRILDWTLAHRWKVFITCTLLTLITGTSVFYMKYETNPVNYLDEALPAKEGILWFEKNMSGAANIEMVLESEKEGAFLDAKQVMWMTELQKSIEAIPGVRAVVSVPEMLRQVKGMSGEGFVFPESPMEAASKLWMIMGFSGHELSAFLTKDGRHTRFTIITDTVDYVGFNRIQDDVKAACDKISAATPSPHPVNLIFTGKTEMLTGITAYLASTLIESLVITVVGVGLLVFFTFMSVRVMAMSLLQNLFGIALMFGFMYLIGIKFNTATILIASVLLGIEIDNTIHWLYHTRQGRSLGKNFRDAGHFNLTITGRAIGSTNFIIACGFAVFYLSDFPPIRHFGILIAVGMIFAIAGVLIYLPAIVSIFAPNVGLSKKTLDKAEADAEAKLTEDPA